MRISSTGPEYSLRDKTSPRARISSQRHSSFLGAGHHPGCNTLLLLGRPPEEFWLSSFLVHPGDACTPISTQASRCSQSHCLFPDPFPSENKVGRGEVETKGKEQFPSPVEYCVSNMLPRVGLTQKEGKESWVVTHSGLPFGCMAVFFPLGCFLSHGPQQEPWTVLTHDTACSAYPGPRASNSPDFAHEF